MKFKIVLLLLLSQHLSLAEVVPQLSIADNNLKIDSTISVNVLSSSNALSVDALNEALNKPTPANSDNNIELKGISAEDLDFIRNQRLKEKKKEAEDRKNRTSNMKKDIVDKQKELVKLENMEKLIQNFSDINVATNEDLAKILNNIKSAIDTEDVSLKDIEFYLDKTKEIHDKQIKDLSIEVGALERKIADREASINTYVDEHNNLMKNKLDNLRTKKIEIIAKQEENKKYAQYLKDKRQKYLDEYKAEQENLSKQTNEFKRRYTKDYEKLMELFSQNKVLDNLRLQENAISLEFQDVEKKKLLSTNKALHEDMTQMKSLLMQMFEAARVQQYARDEAARDFVTVKTEPILDAISKAINNRANLKTEKEEQAEKESVVLMRDLIAYIKTRDEEFRKNNKPVDRQAEIANAVKVKVDNTKLDQRAIDAGLNPFEKGHPYYTDTVNLLMKLEDKNNSSSQNENQWNDIISQPIHIPSSNSDSDIDSLLKSKLQKSEPHDDKNIDSLLNR